MSPPTSLLRRLCAAVVVVAVVGAAPAAAQQPDGAPRDERETTAPAGGHDGAAAPATVAAWVAELADARERYLQAGEALAAARRAEQEARTELDAALGAEAEAAAAKARLDRRRHGAVERLEAAQRRVDSLGAVAYVSGGVMPGQLQAVLEGAGPADTAGRRVLIYAAGRVQRDALRELAAAKRQADRDVATAAAALARATARRSSARQVAVETAAQLEEAVSQLEAAAGRVLRAREALVAFSGSATLTGVDLPLVAVDAYQQGARWGRATFAGCQLEWWMIAGIARVESNHGRYRGAVVTANGSILPPIRGIALDGTRSAAIADTDGGLLDGDPVWDRAVGPTQFIPATWRAYAERFDLDGNGDGVEDPDNIYDAARATGAYLCRNGGTLTTAEERGRAAFAYNRSSAYVAAVLRWMDVYATLGLPDLAGADLTGGDLTGGDLTSDGRGGGAASGETPDSEDADA